MDPLSTSFQPSHDYWKLSNSVRQLQDTQQDHADRISRLEQRHTDDARVKTVWGQPSPFHTALGSASQPLVSTKSTPPQPWTAPGSRPFSAASNQAASSEFANFDDEHSASMMRSLQLDNEEEPRRVGPTSRANSVRFDESANQGQWAQASRPSMDLFPRAPSGFGSIGGLPLIERTSSHRSDGNKSSAAHSASGRANSLGLDLGISTSSSAADLPGLAPGYFFLGSVPSIIRCWLGQDFKHATLLYAAICTGSYQSFLDSRLINVLGFQHLVHRDISGVKRIKLPVYLSEAVPHQHSSRNSSPAPQLPYITVDFAVTESQSPGSASSKVIQIFIGSDALRSHHADVLFSENRIVLYDGERNKLYVPLVRPENDETFKTLAIASDTRSNSRLNIETSRVSSDAPSPSNDNAEEASKQQGAIVASSGRSDMADKAEEVSSVPTNDESNSISAPVDEELPEQDSSQKPVLEPIKTSVEDHRDDNENGTSSGGNRGSSPAIWGSWRREGPSSQQPAQNDWAKATRSSSSTYVRPNRQEGMKVLKPTRQLSRSSSGPQGMSPISSGPSRTFEDIKRRNGNNGLPPVGNSSDSGESVYVKGTETNGKSGVKENVTPGSGTKPRSANPIGGASAFGWLNSGQNR